MMAPTIRKGWLPVLLSGEIDLCLQVHLQQSSGIGQQRKRRIQMRRSTWRYGDRVWTDIHLDRQGGLAGSLGLTSHQSRGYDKGIGQSYRGVTDVDLH